MQSYLRKWFGLFVAVAVYYLVHEGAHALAACALGAFEGVRFLGLGMQIVIDDTLLSPAQLAVFCLLGSAAALAAGWLMTALTGRLTRVKSKPVKSAAFYTTIALLFIDPLYLSVLYRFFGGGDMNGILLLGLPEIAVQIAYAAIGLVNLYLFRKKVSPAYKAAFS